MAKPASIVSITPPARSKVNHSEWSWVPPDNRPASWVDRSAPPGTLETDYDYHNECDSGESQICLDPANIGVEPTAASQGASILLLAAENQDVASRIFFGDICLSSMSIEQLPISTVQQGAATN